MATIDPRLLPLIETLVGSGADWLAFEILDGIRSGRPAEESAEEVSDGRSAVRSFRRHRGVPPPELEPGETFVEALEGDEQIQFAASYAIDRIAEAIEMARVSIRQLNQIVSRSEGRTEPVDIDSADDPRIYIRLEDSDATFTEDQSREALKRLPELKEALLAWSRSVRQREHEE